MKKKSASLWTESPCTLAFSQHRIALEKGERFSFNSIYYTEKHQPKHNVKLQIIRPQSSLQQFRRKIQECQKYRRNLSRQAKSVELFKKNEGLHSMRESKISQYVNQKLIQRLTPTQPIEVDKMFDRNGMRSTYFSNRNGEECIRYSFKKSKNLEGSIALKIFKGPKVYVSGSTRIDLSKPQNFNPGPGSYFLDRRDNQHISLLYRKAHLSSFSKKHKSQLSSPEMNKNSKAFDQLNYSLKQNQIPLQNQTRHSKGTLKKSKLGRIATAIKSRTMFETMRAC